MKTTTAMVALLGSVSARELSVRRTPLSIREVPQEHSHQAVLDIINPILQQNNPLQIQDAVFGLLGNKAAAEGAPNVQDLDCLQQIVADQVFTNAAAAGDINGQANAIIYRALERNTGSVGLASVACTQTAVNPEIAAIQQHQDPASKEAAGNAQIELNVAQQLANIGADPNLALNSATFPPGQIGDPTAKGQTCDVADDKAGCIVSQNLLTPAVSKAQIAAAVGGAGGAAAAGAGANAAGANAAGAAAAAGAGANAAGAAAAGAGAAASAADAKSAGADAKSAGADANAAGADAAGAAASATQGANVQTFTGALGGPPPPVISSDADPKRPFSVDGSTFVNKGAALQRSCSVQHNACATAANSGDQIAGGVQACETQQSACEAASGAAKRAIGQKLRLRAADTGSCGSPAIVFGAGFDGRKENSFEPADKADFTHGSALKIGVISDFICGQLSSKCKASADTVSACDAASTAAKADTAQNQKTADTFNAALGVSA